MSTPRPRRSRWTRPRLVRDSVAHSTRRGTRHDRGASRRRRGDATIAAMRSPVGAGAELVRTASSVGRALAPATVPMSPVMRNRGLGRRLDVFDLPLDDVRRAAKATEGSVNDVFVAAVIGGLQRYHERHGDVARRAAHDAADQPPPRGRRRRRQSLRARALRGAGVDRRPARTCRRRYARSCAASAAEPFLQLTGPLAGMLNRLPTATTTALFGGMLKCCDFVATNVPGAPVPVFAGGAQVERLYAFAPPAGAAVNVSLISHCDTCCIGIVTDTTAVPDAGAFVECTARRVRRAPLAILSAMRAGARARRRRRNLARQRLGAHRRAGAHRRDRRRGRRPAARCSPRPSSTTPTPRASAGAGSARRRRRAPGTRGPRRGPGFRPEQHVWQAKFPFPGSGALNRLCVHPAIVDFVERALDTTDIRLYQTHTSAKYTGETNYEQPMHTDRNHSWLPPISGPPWYHVETFLYLSDVDEGTRADPPRAPTPVRRTRRRPRRSSCPQRDPELYAAELPAAGVRGSLLAYRNDVFHRGVDITAPGGAAVPPRARVQGRGHRLDRLRRRRSRGRRRPTGSRSPKRCTPPRARAVRLPAARPPDLDRGAARRHRRALPEARSRTLARAD